MSAFPQKETLLSTTLDYLAEDVARTRPRVDLTVKDDYLALYIHQRGYSYLWVSRMMR